MATLTIRKFDDAAYARLANRAKRNNRSLEAEARHQLESGSRNIDDIVADLRAIRELSKGKLGPYPDSVALIRAVRDEE